MINSKKCKILVLIMIIVIMLSIYLGAFITINNQVAINIGYALNENEVSLEQLIFSLDNLINLKKLELEDSLYVDKSLEYLFNVLNIANDTPKLLFDTFTKKSGVVNKLKKANEYNTDAVKNRIAELGLNSTDRKLDLKYFSKVSYEQWQNLYNDILFALNEIKNNKEIVNEILKDIKAFKNADQNVIKTEVIVDEVYEELQFLRSILNRFNDDLKTICCFFGSLTEDQMYVMQNLFEIILNVGYSDYLTIINAFIKDVPNGFVVLIRITYNSIENKDKFMLGLQDFSKEKIEYDKLINKAYLDRTEQENIILKNLMNSFVAFFN